MLWTTVDRESALRSAGTLLLWVRAPPPAPWADGGPESLRSLCCGLAITKAKQPTHISVLVSSGLLILLGQRTDSGLNPLQKGLLSRQGDFAKHGATSLLA
ncbi:hypothetical protein PoB_005926200 [Plakobranchus ocellatus]|uniref:Uncharacterized protein n=1 Tax=Plakobranchus ocellatus TaxID=259542 RepID=A0AAV4CLK4_9GAST|nr:hypothetical protein PoB_005926200 [Plakobranchus ocellatus]